MTDHICELRSLGPATRGPDALDKMKNISPWYTLLVVFVLWNLLNTTIGRSYISICILENLLDRLPFQAPTCCTDCRSNSDSLMPNPVPASNIIVVLKFAYFHSVFESHASSPSYRELRPWRTTKKASARTLMQNHFRELNDNDKSNSRPYLIPEWKKIFWCVIMKQIACLQLVTPTCWIY
jgi:hypothetical protein